MLIHIPYNIGSTIIRFPCAASLNFSFHFLQLKFIIIIIFKTFNACKKPPSCKIYLCFLFLVSSSSLMSSRSLGVRRSLVLFTLNPFTLPSVSAFSGVREWLYFICILSRFESDMWNRNTYGPRKVAKKLLISSRHFPLQLNGLSPLSPSPIFHVQFSNLLTDTVCVCTRCVIFPTILDFPNIFLMALETSDANTPPLSL